jgi:Raf kinase inhibitor-like YbhB/YbcL family protein
MLRRLLLFVALLPAAAFAAGPFTLSSAEINPGARIAEAQVFNGFGCDGGNVSPSLAWENAPAGTKSFALTVFDPDAPIGSRGWHWVMLNIPADVKALPAGAGDPAGGKAPREAVQSRTDFGKPGYGGPCPPKGDRPHRYIFTIHALKVDHVDVDQDASGALAGFMIDANEIDKATLTGKYGRK